MSIFTQVSEPNQAWLVVPKNKFLSTGLTRDYFSSRTFVTNDGTVLLAKEADAPLFLSVWAYRFEEATVDEVVVPSSEIKSLPIFGCARETGPAREHVAELATTIAADRMKIKTEDVARLIEWSAWGSVAEMISREFGKRYKGYYPSCGMPLRSEAVVAEVFDAIALLLRDPRRAVRWNAA